MEQAGFEHLTLTRPHLILLEINSLGHGQTAQVLGPWGSFVKAISPTKARSSVPALYTLALCLPSLPWTFNHIHLLLLTLCSC